MVQTGREITPARILPCINCGECVRACPANIPVNMLIRLLENRLYEMAVSEYDLLSCIECGLCSYVCVARIPVFQYIMLGKNEYLKLKSEEGYNV
jgi:electron transport complex protein RnfC